MDTHCQMATKSRSSDCQNVGVVSSLESKTGGGGRQLHITCITNLVGTVCDELSFFSLYYMKYICIYCMISFE